MHRICVQDIAVGASLCSVFLIASATMGESKNGPFWRLELRDATGNIEAKIWSPLSQKVGELKSGDFVEIKAKASLYRDQKQLTIEALRPVEDPEQIDIADFMPTSAVEPSVILSRIEELVQAELSYTPWKNFAKSVLNDARIRAKLLLAPAAKSVHHAYAGGLLEHMHSVASLCLKLSDHYEELDRQTLFVAGLFHDIGKLDELSGGLVNDYTNEGKLLGHIIQGVFMLKPFLEKAKVPPALALHFEHLILSHHGELEYGAPKVPATAEAFVLHYADNMDAKLAQCREVFGAEMAKQKGQATGEQRLILENMGQGVEGASEQEASSQAKTGIVENISWSPWINLLGRTLCHMPQTPAKVEKDAVKKKSPKEKQGSLLG